MLSDQRPTRIASERQRTSLEYPNGVWNNQQDAHGISDRYLQDGDAQTLDEGFHVGIRKSPAGKGTAAGTDHAASPVA